MHKAAWTNGRSVIHGYWQYNWASDVFVIELDRRDRITGRARVFTVHGDVPEWGNWVRVGSSCQI